MKLSLRYYFPALLALLSTSIDAFSSGAKQSWQQHRYYYCPSTFSSSSRMTTSRITSSTSSSTFPPSRQHENNPSTSTTILKMSSDFDFPSAMPEKPQQSMKEKLQDSATQFIADITLRLEKGVEPPPELEALKAARDDEEGDVSTLALRIYELMIEQGMLYDVDADTGKLSPTDFDIKNNLDIPEVKAEFDHLYKYGIELIKRGMIDVDLAKETVKERLIKRTGLSPEEFDEWLGY